AAAIDGNPQTGWAVNGGQGKRHVAVFTLAAPLADARDLCVQMLFEKQFAAGLGRFRLSVTADRTPAVARDIPAADEELLLMPAGQHTEEQRHRLRQCFLSSVPELAGARAAIDQLRKQMPAYLTTLVMKERLAENPRPTFLHTRGEFLQPAERVEPAVPS